MQMIARELNNSETAFLFYSNQNDRDGEIRNIYKVITSAGRIKEVWLRWCHMNKWISAGGFT
jgi:hypothetical protein